MPNENIGPKSDIQICVPDFKNKVAYMTWYDFFELNQPPNLKSLRENQSSYIREVASDSGRVIKKDWVYDNNAHTPIPLHQIRKFMKEWYLQTPESDFKRVWIFDSIND